MPAIYHEESSWLICIPISAVWNSGDMDANAKDRVLHPDYQCCWRNLQPNPRQRYHRTIPEGRESSLQVFSVLSINYGWHLFQIRNIQFTTDSQFTLIIVACPFIPVRFTQTLRQSCSKFGNEVLQFQWSYNFDMWAITKCIRWSRNSI